MVQQNALIAAFMFSTNLLSFIATLFVLLAYFKYDQLKATKFKYILFICLMDQCQSIIMIADCIYYYSNYHPSMSLCITQAFLKTFSALQGFFWTAVVCHTLKQSVLFNDQNAFQFNIWFIYCISLATFLSIMPLVNNAYGFVYPIVSTTCFITTLKYEEGKGYIDKSGTDKVIADWCLMGCFYIPLYIVITYNFYCVLKVYRNLNKEIEKNEKEQLRALFWYPGILIIIWGIISINRIMNVAGILDSKILDYFDYTFIGLNGLLDSIFYAQNSIVGRTTIKEDLKILLRM